MLFFFNIIMLDFLVAAGALIEFCWFLYVSLNMFTPRGHSDIKLARFLPPTHILCSVRSSIVMCFFLCQQLIGRQHNPSELLTCRVLEAASHSGKWLKVKVFNLYTATRCARSVLYAPNTGISKYEVASTKQDEGHLQLHQNLLILSNHL